MIIVENSELTGLSNESKMRQIDDSKMPAEIKELRLEITLQNNQKRSLKINVDHTSFKFEGLIKLFEEYTPLLGEMLSMELAKELEVK